MQNKCFFLGANAPKGYYSRFDQLFTASPKGRCFLIKGGPGTGKSTVLKKLASVLEEKGLSTELIYCSADTNSLDAIITEDGKFTALDATAPHFVEPKYPGAYETAVNLSDCWNEGILREHADKIAALFDENRRLHEEARRYISSAATLLEEAAKLAADRINPDKITKTALNVCQREFGKQKGRQGTEKLRFLSAVTDKGVFVFNETAKLLCKKIYLLEDETGTCSRIFLSTVRKAALEQGFDIITCRCPIFPGEKIEHIFIPEIGLGFMTDNKRHNLKVPAYRTIHARRFGAKPAETSKRLRLRFALKEATRLIGEAVLCLKEAKRVHDELEAQYIPAMDFSKVEEKLAAIVNCI